jgi:hypothetical protein
VTVDPARLVYEVRVTDPSSGERDKALAKTVLANLLAMGTGHMEAPVPAKVEVLVVDRRTNQVVFRRREDPVEARRTTMHMSDNLNRLDATAFARECGIGVEAASRPRVHLRNVPRGLWRLLRVLLGRR